MDENLKEKIDEVGTKIDDKVEETAAKYSVPKWAVWLGGAIVLGVLAKVFF
jgi:hypothetical protein